MRFVDEAKIFIKAGDGGKGCSSFRREAHEPRGGPDGGDGGRGGSVFFKVNPHISTLSDFRYKRTFEASRGEHGRGKQQYGHSGEDLIIPVPQGTFIKDEHGDILADLSEPNQTFLIAQGGRGGRGNMHFKSSTNRAPRRSDPGEKGEEKFILLELKLLADVGLIGKPNAGKSTLLSKISRAKPKIADYPFTTLVPQLGVVEPFKDYPGFTVADIPGLIEGAHLGTGLGLEFLKHIERTRVFLHLIDLSNEEDPIDAYEEIRKELQTYNPDFKKRMEWIILTKTDLVQNASSIKKIKTKFEKKKKKVFVISSATGDGIKTLISKLAEEISKTK